MAAAADLAIVRTPAEEAIIARYPAFKARQAHWSAPLIERLRDQGFATLKSGGLPNRRVEEWKYTDLRAFMRELPEPFSEYTKELVEAAGARPPVLDSGDAPRILFVNGRSFATLKEDGFSYRALGDGDPLPPETERALARARAYQANPAVALNAAFMQDWIVLRVPAGTALARPLHLDFRDAGSSAFAACPRVLVIVEEGASATVVESHDGPDGVAYLTNALIEFDIADGASADHVRLNASGRQALALSTLGVRLGREANFSTVAMSTGAAVTRQQVFLDFDGEDSKAFIGGATLLRGDQHCDSTLVITHAAPGCFSRELFKTVLDDEARGVFQGKIVVRPHAQKTDGKMASHAVLLSAAAEMDNKPELEIWADDVVCGHGATCGELDENLLFYLRARGIPASEAEALLLQSFVGEPLEQVKREGLRESMTGVVTRWLESRA